MASSTASTSIRRITYLSSKIQRRILPNSSTLVSRMNTTTILTRGGGHHEDHTMEPPFHRIPLPSKPVCIINNDC